MFTASTEFFPADEALFSEVLSVRNFILINTNAAITTAIIIIHENAFMQS